MAIPKHIYNQYVKPTQTKPKAQGTPYNPPKPPQQQMPGQGTPPPQVPYGGTQYNQNYAAQQAAAYAAQQAQAYAAQQAAQQQAAMKAQAEAAIEARRQMLAEQAKQKQENFNNAIPGMAGWGIGQEYGFQPQALGNPIAQASNWLANGLTQGVNQFGQVLANYGNLTNQQGGWQFENLFNPNAWAQATQPGAGAPVPGMAGYQLPQQDVYGRGYVSPEQRKPNYPWMEPGYYMTQQQINTLMGQTGATINPAQQYQNPPGPRGQKGPYTPQDERQWAFDRDTNEQFQGVTKGYESRLLYGMEPPPGGGGGGGGGGYNYPYYGGGGGGGYTPYEPTKSWYENMLNWNIG